MSLKKPFLTRRGYKSFEDWNSDPDHVYIGPDMSHHVEGAVDLGWGNPYKPKKGNKASLYRCLKRYEDRIRRNPDLFNAVLELEGKELGCWCKPSPCHCDILIKLFRERKCANQPSPRSEGVFLGSGAYVDSDLEASIESLPLLEQTPLINNTLETPILSPNSVISKLGGDSGADDEISTRDVLFEAGYTSFEIKNAISQSSELRLKVKDFGKDCPRTHVFSQGKTFTYENLSIKPLNESKKSAKSSFSQPSNLKYPLLNPEPKAIPNNPEDSLKNDPNQHDLDAFSTLKNIRVENLKNIIIGQLNINSLRNKIYDLIELIKESWIFWS